MTSKANKWAVTFDNAGAKPNWSRPYIIVDQTTGVTVCEIAHSHTPVGDQHAKMIVATPELVSALRRLVNQAELTDDYADSEYSTLRDAIKKARAVLARVEDKVTIG